MAYWTRPAFGLLDSGGTQAAYIGGAKLDMQSMWIPMKQLALDLHVLDDEEALEKFEACKQRLLDAART
ncbi:unnamed protein product [Symbiodinium sp. CCMP2592]|nr:unnamed protein product [Symbiodinium sp. CCMP2592]